uniref:SGNH hydrolase-type esterase domain-containing protein n=1 Tax=Oryzias melastigma TaxID=30732 RepID=A0A3B3DC12_ORYME
MGGPTPRGDRNTKVLCFPNDMVSDMQERILKTVAKYPSVQNIVLHTGSNDVSKQKSEVLKQDFTGLIRTVSSMKANVFISGPIPTIRGGKERFSRLLALNRWLSATCGDTGIHFINNFHIFWEQTWLRVDRASFLEAFDCCSFPCYHLSLEFPRYL